MCTTFLLAALLASAPPPADPQSVKAGTDAWQERDYTAAIAIWTPLAEKGDADAQFNLGEAYRLGRGVPLDQSLAQIWLERAARQAHLDAQTTLGILMFDSGNRVGGLHWLKLAADAGEPRALLMYGTALFNGDGVARNPLLAYAIVSRAASQGFAPAEALLAQMDHVLPPEQRQKGVALARANGAGRRPTALTVRVKSKAQSIPQDIAASAARGSWRVQLGAFNNRGSARILFVRLTSAGALDRRQAYFVPVGARTRLQAGPFASYAMAAAACASLKGQACFPVAGK